jgi:hypothetical protein
MSTTKPMVNEMLVIVKSREIQRAWLAERANQPDEARKHYLAGGALEMVLADDYRQVSEEKLARRSRISAATCFWRAGARTNAEEVLEQLRKEDPARAAEVDRIRHELEHGPRDED